MVRWVEVHKMEMQPNLFIPGAPKCGTTSLAVWLNQYPEVCLGSLKEPHYYNTDEQYVRVDNRADYLSLYSGCTEEHAYRLDASPWYLHSQEAIPNILSDCPGARFLVCIRNPVDMAFSLHGHFLNKSCREHIVAFEQAWELSDERMLGRAVSRRASDPRYLAYKNACRIGSQCKRLLERVHPEQVYFVVFDELVNNRQGTLKAVLEFLEIESKKPLVFPRENIRKDVRCIVVQRGLRRMDKVMSRMGIAKKSIFGLRKILKRINASPSPRTMDPLTRRRVAGYFQEEIELIWEILGRRYESWLTDP